LTLETIAVERAALDLQTFAVERCGAGPWRRGDGTAGVIPADDWLACEDRGARAIAGEDEPLDGLVFAFDTAADRKSTAIAACGTRDDNLPHIEIVDIVTDTALVPARVAELVGRHNPVAVVADAAGPTAALLPGLDVLGVKVTLVSSAEHAVACAMFYDFVRGRSLRYRRTEKWGKDLDQAVAIATKRSLGGDGGFGWSRKGSSASIAPLVSVTLALWGLQTIGYYDGPLLEWI
jgi:hypothetical protein